MNDLTDTDVQNRLSQKLGIKVLLVDDQPMIAEGIRRMLASEEDIALHYCQDPSQAINMALEVQPTIILQDLVLPDIDGMTIVRFFRIKLGNIFRHANNTKGSEYLLKFVHT